MNASFDAALNALGHHLGITLTATDGVASITLDNNHTLHLAALGDSQLALFMRLSPLKDVQQAIELLQQNLFSVDPASPRIALSPDNHLILWSQHPLSVMDGSALYQALSTLHHHGLSRLSASSAVSESSGHDNSPSPLLMV
ncbi:CesT family type III secretion system chaperone [Aeromonas finlandensis]|uniref:CesT family type III secretion system chaperone n=1 Tax=Aeromonas finlandensis TaxID=1543375 RepID=UPI0009E03005|nr:CesT family type III secretion system chaperone [Aeromonas finlandensis]